MFLYAGSSIRAAQASNRHILALENDAKLFEFVLLPLKAPSTPRTQMEDVTDALEEANIAGSDSDSGSPIVDLFCE